MSLAFLFLFLAFVPGAYSYDCCPVNGADPNCVCYCFGLAYCSVQCDDAKNGSVSLILPQLSKLNESCTVDLSFSNYYLVDRILPKAFDVGCKITSLNLENNGFATAHPDAFRQEDGSGLNLESLKLFGNRFSAIPTVALSPLRSLTHLRIGGNNIGPSLTTDSFAGLSSLTSLILSMGTGIEVIETGPFQGLNKLNFLSLDDNTLIRLHSGSFDGLVNVEHFGNDGLKFRPGAKIFSDSLSDLKSLKNLVVSMVSPNDHNITRLSTCFDQVNIDCSQLPSLEEVQVVDGICTDFLAAAESCVEEELLVSIPRENLDTEDQKALWLDLTQHNAAQLHVYTNPFNNQTWPTTSLVLGLNGSTAVRSLDYRYPHPPCDSSYLTFPSLTQISLTFPNWPFIPAQLQHLAHLQKISIFYPLVCNCSNFWIKEHLDKLDYPTDECADRKETFHQWIQRTPEIECRQQIPPTFMWDKCYLGETTTSSSTSTVPTTSSHSTTSTTRLSTISAATKTSSNPLSTQSETTSSTVKTSSNPLSSQSAATDTTSSTNKPTDNPTTTKSAGFTVPSILVVILAVITVLSMSHLI